MTEAKATAAKKKRGRKPTPIPWPMDEVEEMYQRYLDGETYQSIAESVDSTHRIIQKTFIKAGLHSKEGTRQHWVNLFNKRPRSSRQIAQDRTATKIDAKTFRGTGGQLRGMIIENIRKKERKAYREELVNKTKNYWTKEAKQAVRTKMDIWDVKHSDDYYIMRILENKYK